MKWKMTLFAAVCSAGAAWNPMVKRDSRVDLFIMQIASTKGVEIPAGFYNLPMHRQEVADFIRFALDSLELSEGERGDAELLWKIYGGERALVKRESDRARIAVNLNLTGDIDLNHNDSTTYGLKGTVNPSVDGYFGGLSFNSEVSVWTEMRTDTIWHVSSYEPYEGNPYNLFGRADSGNVRASDLFRGGVSWQLGLSHWDAGVDYLKSGPVQRNPLMLNLDRSPAAFARMILDFPWFDYTHSAIVLQSNRNFNRYMMHHRVELPLAKKRLMVALNESVVYGSSADSATNAELHNDPVQVGYSDIERDFQPVYLIPFLPFTFIEHFTGDRDNKQISLDFSLRLPERFFWYGEFFLDDISAPHTLFSDDYGNKWAFAAGGKWFTVVGEKNFTLSAEYSRVEPWVYTHFRGMSHRYDHFGTPIGAKTGPNSDLFWSETELQLNQKNRLALSFENRRWNHSQRGGSIDHVMIEDATVEDYPDSLGNPYLVVDSKKKTFLADPVSSEQIVAARWAFLPYRFYEMNTTVQWSSQRGATVALNGGFRF